MDEHELTEKMKTAFKGKQMTKELFQEALDWCNVNTENMDLTNTDHFYLYLTATRYLMKPNQVLEWNESDVNIVMNFMAKRALRDFHLNQNTSIEILNREEYDQRNRGTSRAVCVDRGDNTYDIEYSPDVKDLLLSRDTGKILRGFQILFHEIVHALQNTTIRKEGVNSAETYLMAMETIARKQSPEIYDANYAHLLKENHAEKLGLEIAMINIQHLGPDLYSLYHQDVVEQMKKKYDARYYEGKIDLFGKSRRCSAQIDKACTQFVGKRPDVLKEFPVLQWGFNIDGTKKTLEQLLIERQSLLDEGKPVDKVNQLFNTLANYKNFVKGTPGGTKEELCYLVDFVAETGTDDEFIFALMEYRLKNTTMIPEKIAKFMQGQRSFAQKVRREREEQEIEIEPKEAESIKDEVDGQFKPKTDSRIQDEKQAELYWMHRVGTVAQEVDKTVAAVKGKQEVVQLVKEIDRKQQQQIQQEEQEEQMQQ